MLRGGGHSVLTQSCCNHVASEPWDIFLLDFLVFLMLSLYLPYVFLHFSYGFPKFPFVFLVLANVFLLFF